MEKIKRLFKDEEGATMVEYALMVALIAVVVIVGAGLLGGAINTKFTTVSEQVTAAPTTPTP